MILTSSDHRYSDSAFPPYPYAQDAEDDVVEFAGLGGYVDYTSSEEPDENPRRSSTCWPVESRKTI